MKKTKNYINLLPPEAKKPKRALSKMVIASGLFALVWLVVLGWQVKQVLDLRSRMVALTADKQAIQQQLAQVYKDLGIALPAGTSPEKAWLIQSLLGERVLWSEVFKQFSIIVPKGLWFDSLEGNAAGKAEIRIRGGAFNYQTVAGFMLAMEKSPYFEKPQLMFAQNVVLQGRETVGFEIVCGIKKT
jgi:Tfp pilus assembly protein PilN